MGSGRRDQSVLLGKPNLITDTYKLVKRIFSGVLILFGLGLLVYQNISISGAVISNSTSVESSFIISLATIGLGGLLLLNSFKK